MVVNIFVVFQVVFIIYIFIIAMLWLKVLSNYLFYIIILLSLEHNITIIMFFSPKKYWMKQAWYLDIWLKQGHIQPQEVWKYCSVCLLLKHFYIRISTQQTGVTLKQARASQLLYTPHRSAPPTPQRIHPFWLIPGRCGGYEGYSGPFS